MRHSCLQCDRVAHAHGLCATHYWDLRRAQGRVQRTRYTRPCVICGSDINNQGKGRTCSVVCRWFDNPQSNKSCPVPDTHPSRSTAIPDDHPVRWPSAWPCSNVWPGVCEWCGSAFIGRHPAAGYCSDRHAHRAAKVRYRARKCGAQGSYTWTQVIGIYLKHGLTCAYCHQPCDGDPDPDHVVPLSRGGYNGIGNILPACRSCNGDKRDHTLDEWAADRRRRGLPPVTTTWESTDPRYSHLNLLPAVPRAALSA